MSSDSLSTIRKYLRDQIKPQVPTRWRIIPELSAALNLTVPALYFEFTEISSKSGGATLPPGQVFCDFDLVVVIPETDTTKAEDRVDAVLLDLVLALDTHSNLTWDTAKKERLATGQLAWRVSVSVLATTDPVTEE